MSAARDLLQEDVSLPQFIMADLADSAWRDTVAAAAPYDAVVSGFAIHHLIHERKRALYDEIYGLLAPGGLFINVEHVASPSQWLEARFDAAVVDSLATYQSQLGAGRSRQQIEHEYHRREDKAANILAPADEQCQWLVEAGFEDVDIYFKFFELAVFGGRKPALGR